MDDVCHTNASREACNAARGLPGGVNAQYGAFDPNGIINGYRIGADFFFNTSTGELFLFNGLPRSNTGWIVVGGGGGAGGSSGFFVRDTLVEMAAITSSASVGAVMLRSATREPGAALFYSFIFGDATVADGFTVVEPDDGGGRYFAEA